MPWEITLRAPLIVTISSVKESPKIFQCSVITYLLGRTRESATALCMPVGLEKMELFFVTFNGFYVCFESTWKIVLLANIQ